MVQSHGGFTLTWHVQPVGFNLSVLEGALLYCRAAHQHILAAGWNQYVSLSFNVWKKLY
jgi:hypothetical protein